MTARRLGYPCLSHRYLHGILEILLLHMMPPHLMRTWVNREFRRWKHILPTPRPFCIRILSTQGKWQIHLSSASGEILPVQKPHLFQMHPQRLQQRSRQYRYPILQAFASRTMI